jgi:hypothetical protein
MVILVGFIVVVSASVIVPFAFFASRFATTLRERIKRWHVDRLVAIRFINGSGWRIDLQHNKKHSFERGRMNIHLNSMEDSAHQVRLLCGLLSPVPSDASCSLSNPHHCTSSNETSPG